MKISSPDLAEVLGRPSTDKRIDILRRIGGCGSISEAARLAGVSYKAAWQSIETLSNLAGTPMVEKAVGGSGGGGAVLTPAGRQVLHAAALLDQARADVLALLEPPARGQQGSQHPGSSLAALALRTSMRNQFPCAVQTVSSAGGLVRVGLALRGGSLLQAHITRESAQLLQLRRTLPLLALCKATAVRVATQMNAADGRNVLAGVVSRASRSVHGGEVALRLPGGVSLVGFCEAGHKLKVGQDAMASVEESAVVLAVAV